MNKFIKIIFLCQILANELHELALKVPLLRPLRSKVKNLTPDLIRLSETHFDNMDEKATAETETIYKVTDDFINQMCKVNFEDYNNLVACYQAMKKDPKSMAGIVNKILK